MTQAQAAMFVVNWIAGLLLTFITLLAAPAKLRALFILPETAVVPTIAPPRLLGELSVTVVATWGSSNFQYAAKLLAGYVKELLIISELSVVLIMRF